VERSFWVLVHHATGMRVVGGWCGGVLLENVAILGRWRCCFSIPALLCAGKSLELDEYSLWRGAPSGTRNGGS